MTTKVDAINIKSSDPFDPRIYAFSTPKNSENNGYIKIGYTAQKVEERVHQICHTAGITCYDIGLNKPARFDDTLEIFRDEPFHEYLEKVGVERRAGLEWFKISFDDAEIKYNKFRGNHGILKDLGVKHYRLRKEQEDAVKQTLQYAIGHTNGEFLWNAKPRFGKTLTTYEFCKRFCARNILIVTNRPAIANSWYDDYAAFFGTESGYYFVSDSLSNSNQYPLCQTVDMFKYVLQTNPNAKCIRFVSLQDLKGSRYFSIFNDIEKLKDIADTEWDVLVVDEAHEGIDTEKTEDAFNRIKRKFTLHLSGTPFKALANDKFPSDAIFNWTYTDEQNAKRNWDSSREEENPYSELPKLNLFAYQMSEFIQADIRDGIEIDGETVNYSFDLYEFFKVGADGEFEHKQDVLKFLDALSERPKYPFSEDYRDELKHTLWILDRVNSVNALKRLLNTHPVFKDYKVVAAVDEKDDVVDESGAAEYDEKYERKLENSFNAVKDAIKNNDKTITLSVKQLTTGVTIEEWTAVLMLNNKKSSTQYMQAAFRAQNKCTFRTVVNISGGQRKIENTRKINAYVFDFNPSRALTIYEEFANNLSPDAALNRDSVQRREDNVKNLLNFFPLISEDVNGTMCELDSFDILSITRRIRSCEVVRCGFMNDYLFQNISNVFSAPAVAREIIDRLDPYQQPTTQSKNVTIPIDKMEDKIQGLPIDGNGEFNPTGDYISDKVNSLFGEKFYETVDNELINRKIALISVEEDKKRDDKFGEAIKYKVNNIVENISSKYDSLTNVDRIKETLTKQAEKVLKGIESSYQIDKRNIERDYEEEMKSRNVSGKSVSEIENERSIKLEELNTKTQEDCIEKCKTLDEDLVDRAVRMAEENKTRKITQDVETGIKAHLRGFSRTIPSFLMAYGDETVTLENFDKIIPAEVFYEVTSITLDQFKFLRDGGDYTDEKTGENKHFNGNIFDSVVFNDSVKEFLNLKRKLADYFDEENTEDIFDYIPSQRNNQIFTPKKIVKQMVDMLEKENPGCFDNPDHTFIDLYMKSGLYIAEIVKRLYQSPNLKKLYPDKTKRLKHIFEKQVYGLAPTEIIYQISKNFILGFDTDGNIKKHNLRQVDALPYAKDGTLQTKLDRVFEN